jgi:hypothetical protein
MDDNLISRSKPAAFKMKRDARGESLATPRRDLQVFCGIGNTQMRRCANGNLLLVGMNESGPALTPLSVRVYRSFTRENQTRIPLCAATSGAITRLAALVPVVVLVVVVVETRSSTMAAALKILCGQGRVFASIFQIARHVRVLASSHSSS